MRDNIIMLLAAMAILGIIAWGIYDAGRDDANTQNQLKQHEANDAALKRKAALKPADSRSTVERLRAGNF